MNRQRELAKNTIILTVGKICTQFASFLLLPLYTALLVPEESGIVDVFNSFITLLTPICNWQFENGLFRFMIDERKDFQGQKRLFSTVLFANIAQAGAYLVFFCALQSFIHSEYKIFLAIDVTLNIFLNTLLQFPRGLGNNVIYSVGSFVSAVSTIALNVLFIAGFHWGAYGMFLATMFGKIITIFYLFIATKSWKYISFHSADKAVFREVSKYSLPLVPNQLSWWVVGTSDRMVISHFIGLAENGLYFVANKFSTVFVTFYNIFNLSWTESVSLHMQDEDRDDFLTDIINTMFNLFAAVDIGIIACMPFLYHFGFVNQQYDRSYYQVPILMAAVLFQVIVGLYSVVYVALKMSKEIAKTSLLAAIINLSIDLLLIKQIGLYAASISTLIAYASMAIYRYFDVKKYVNVLLKPKNVLLTSLVMGITIGSYYYRNLFVCTATFAVVVLYAVINNRGFFLTLINGLKSKLKKR